MECEVDSGVDSEARDDGINNLLLIVNPSSGRGISRTALGTIVSQFCDSGRFVTVCFTGEKTAEQLAFDHAKYFETVVCVGGDGTLSSVVSGLVRSGVSIPVGYIPAGTANDIAHTHALSRAPYEAVRTILNGKQRPLDIGLFIDRYFTYIAAFGAFTDIAYSTPQSSKRAFGHFAYILEGFAGVSAIKAQHAVIKYDGGVIEGDFIFGGVMNSTSVAGFVKLDPELVDLADGMFEVILVKQPIIFADFLNILTSIATMSYDGDNVLMFRASKVSFTFKKPVAWTVDGEDGGSHKHADITNCREAIRIIV